MKNLAIAVVLVLGVFAISANMEDETKIGYVDKVYILERLPEYQKAKILLQNFESDDTKELAKAEEEITLLLVEINELKEKEGKAGLEEAKLLKKMGSFEKRSEVLSAKIRSEKEEFWDQQTKAAKYRLEKALYNVAGKSGYTHVFAKPSRRLDGELLLAPEKDDLTRKVMENLELKSEDYQLEK